MWVPAHKGIEINKKANKLDSRKGTTKKIYKTQTILCKISQNIFKCMANAISTTSLNQP